MPDANQTLRCRYSSLCSGCGWITKPYFEQQSLKLKAFLDGWKNSGLPPLGFQPRFATIAEAGLRDRVDLIIDRRTGSQRLGLFDLEHKEIVDLEDCPQLSPALQKWFHEFRKIEWPILRGSVRLRVAPNGSRGAWLDFANTDVKTLFEEKNILQNLLKVSKIEIGQRRKVLVEDEDRLRLKDPELFTWFETFVGDSLVPTSLLCHVGSFTQPSFKANKVLVEEIMALIPNSLTRIAEFGSGVGNFTLPLASISATVDAFEIDRLACEALAKNLENAGLTHKVRIHQGDFQSLNDKRTFSPEEFDLIFVDPPRSGLKEFLKPFESSKLKPTQFVYVSCYPESFCADAARLYRLGYKLQSVTIVDQFPQTSHAELVANFSS